ncbi:MAG: sugar ABC transporter substrate-binding protein [Anaerolineae bacterium]
MSKTFVLLALALILAVAVVGCGSAPAPAASQSQPAQQAQPAQPAQAQATQPPATQAPAAKAAPAATAPAQAAQASSSSQGKLVDTAAIADCKYAAPTPLKEGAQASSNTLSYKGGDMTIAYLPMGTEFNYHVALNEGIKSIAAQNPHIKSFMLSPYKGTDQAAQMGMLQDVTNRDDVNAIVLISFDEQALAPLVTEAVKKGKAVIIVNSDIPNFPTPVHGVIGVNQRAVNKKLADWARQTYGEGAKKVAVLEGEPGYLNDQRSGGFKDGVNGTNWKVITSVNGGWSVDKGNRTAMDVLQAHPDTEVLYAANDYMAEGAALAAKELGRKDLVILGYDGDTNALEDIYNGTMTATTNTMPVIMGRLAACYAIDILNGKTQGGYVNTPTEIVTKDNAGQVLAKVNDLYPKPSDEILKKLGVSSN